MQRARLAFVVCGGSVVLGLAGCSGHAEHAAEPAGATSASSSATARPASHRHAHGAKPVAVHRVIHDPVMGDRVVVQRFVRDFPVPAAMSAVPDREIVLVRVTVTAGSKYYAGWDTSSLSIVTPGGGVNDESETDDLDAAMIKAGYRPFPDTGDVDTGKTAGGWVPFVVDPKDSPRLTLQMKREAATTSDGKTLPAKTFAVRLVSG